MKHLSKEASKLGKLRKKLQAVEVWTRRRHVSVKLRRRIRSYYAEVWVRYEGAQRPGDPSTLAQVGQHKQGTSQSHTCVVCGCDGRALLPRRDACLW